MFTRLRELREDKDLTQSQVAKLLNMSQTGYSQYEIGKNDVPTRVLIMLARFYNVSVDYLLNMTDDMKPYKRA
ncbi:MAG: helix-turn-helix transcriptional regulator [Clostridia bacterium]|jgi:transcriptional regulator with XRE-family HTH domain|nr:helix-turn-helix transcriptional regulator [Clostridia bacterium]